MLRLFFESWLPPSVGRGRQLLEGVPPQGLRYIAVPLRTPNKLRSMVSGQMTEFGKFSLGELVRPQKNLAGARLAFAVRGTYSRATGPDKRSS